MSSSSSKGASPLRANTQAGQLLAWSLAGLCGIAGACSSSSPPPAPVSQPAATKTLRDDGGGEVHYQGSYALIIGVSHYQTGWKELPGVEEDVAAVKTLFEELGFEVTGPVLNPTHDKLLATIDDFIYNQGAEPEAQVLIYYAGHGKTLPPIYAKNWESEDADLGYVTASDTPRVSEDAPGFRRKAIPLDQFEVYARQIQAKHALFLFDSCFAGTIFQTVRSEDSSEAIKELIDRPVRLFITSGEAGESVPDRSEFRRQLELGLRGDADIIPDGYVTGDELAEFLYTRLAVKHQHPQSGTLRNRMPPVGDFVFRLPHPPAVEIALEAPAIDWPKWLSQMHQAFRETQDSAGKPGTTKVSQLSQWQAFLDSYPYNAPETQEDDDLRRQARAQRDSLQSQLDQPPPQPKPGDRRVDDRALKLAFRYVPPGTFTMGSPEDEPGRDPDETQHEVTLTRGLWVGETEVTQGQWQQLMGTNPSRFTTCGADCPVEQVTWYEALEFANRLSRQAGLQECYRLDGCTTTPEGAFTCTYTELTLPGQCRGYRLPTEAEWEYSARAGSQGPQYRDNLADIAWCLTTSETTTYPVGTKRPNAWKLSDMLGNVNEWVEDQAEYRAKEGWFTGVEEAPTTNPRSTVQATTRRMRRGGAWSSQTRYCRAASRVGSEPDERLDNVGLRVVRTAG